MLPEEQGGLREPDATLSQSEGGVSVLDEFTLVRSLPEVAFAGACSRK